MMTRTANLLLTLVVVLPLAAAAGAPPRNITATVAPDATLPYLTQVVYPRAHCAAVSDSLGLLAFGQRRVDGKSGEVAIFALDAQGNPVGQPAPTVAVTAPPAPPAPPSPAAPAPAAPPPLPLYTISLPQPAALAKFGNTAISLAFHPKLPLLYIWQDTSGPPLASAKSNPVMKEFDHLLIYRVAANAPPQLVLATARGRDYAYSIFAGAIVLDGDGGRLFLPNLRRLTSPDNSSLGACGFCRLDGQGLPIRDAGDVAPVLTLDDASPFTQYPVALGYVPVSDAVTVVGGCYGPMTWDRENRRGVIDSLYLVPTGVCTFRMVGHPALPVLFVTMVGATYAFRMEHADGYITQLPQSLVLPGASLQNQPVVLTRRKKVAFGGVNRVYVAALDGDGAFTGAVEQQPLISPAVEAMAYSDKHDRLYAAVEPAAK